MSNKIKIVIYALLLVMNLVTTTATAETIKITNGEWPPFLSEKYKHFGLASHIVTEAFKASGVSVEYGFFPWARAFNLAKDGDKWAATVVWSHNDEREADFYFSQPVFSLQSVFFHVKGRTIDWNQLSDLKKFNIGATIGYNYGDEFTKLEESHGLNVTRVETDLINLKKLVGGRIDLFPSELQVGYELIANELPPEQAAKIAHSRPFRETEYYMLLSKKYPGGKELIDKFNAGLAKIKASGLYDQMMSDSVEGAYKPN
ncbi:hypothetical protein BTA51_22755 [Hahella sp. CCB-MM4]|uniref:substrate-binding periplasmic protein n=1 Tax=Hahella sp. (strain CCB-MM4) TaxID=1926491 RepID=UPI000B9B7130|nr:transporter substrate-binding domain-containing protein [Hahella sp. CCB-MM4]OZG71191.1 hypothetical protein BTA51_22755 [Hahella sp. CCB-MM4]